ncbi:MAG: GTP-binding protein [Alphaproteobacteria bacterium]|nr:GTP-binding protein [Alphaproteobacteria bacterium]
MKMKMFSAPTLEQATALMRAEMGKDAVILSTREEDGIVEIRAAVDRSFNHRFAAPRFAEVRPVFDAARDQLSNMLRWHGAPDGFLQMVAEAGSRFGAGSEPLGALSAGLEGVLSFAPLQPHPEKSILLVGGPGSGKTTAAAKLVLQLSDADSPLEPISADFDAAGQAEKLAALMLRPSLTVALSPDALQRIIEDRDALGRRAIVDAPPFNPVDRDDMKRLNTLISRLNVEPVLVMSADGNPMEMEDNARSFAQLGVRRAILTRLDAVRRRGGVIAAISSSRLSIAQLGSASNALKGLVPASASRVAKLLLDNAPEAELLKGAA